MGAQSRAPLGNTEQKSTFPVLLPLNMSYCMSPDDEDGDYDDKNEKVEKPWRDFSV